MVEVASGHALGPTLVMLLSSLVEIAALASAAPGMAALVLLMVAVVATMVVRVQKAVGTAWVQVGIKNRLRQSLPPSPCTPSQLEVQDTELWFMGPRC